MIPNAYRISERELSLACLVTIASAMIIFASGYLLGRQHGLHKTIRQLNPSSLADILYTRLSMTDKQGIASVARNRSETHLEEEMESPCANPEIMESLAAAEEECEDTRALAGAQESDGTFYRAILAGYGSREGALRYLQTLSKRGIPASVRERSGLRRGKPRIWYQVVTAPLSKERTQDIVRILQKVDRLYDVSLESIEGDLAQ